MVRVQVVAALILAIVVTGPATRVRAQEPSLNDLLSPIVRYVTSYQEALSGLVSEERYAQLWRRGDKVRETRTLRSDVLLTRPAGGKRFLLLRDVFEVDGHQVRDRDERLLRLFLKPSASTSSQAVRILDESARYNIGDIGRTINTPTLALAFLDPRFRDRFEWERSADTVPESVRSGPATDEDGRFSAAADLAVVGYKEVGRESLIGTGSSLNLFSSGRFWFEPDTGRIVMSEVHFRNKSIDALIAVKYEVAPAVGLLVPAVMKERFADLRKDSIVEGTATYSRVRRFQVTDSEAVKDEPQ